MFLKKKLISLKQIKILKLIISNLIENFSVKKKRTSIDNHLQIGILSLKKYFPQINNSNINHTNNKTS